MHALRDDYALGGLTAVEEIVHADLFDDFLDMAGELLSKGFTGPAAVLAGTVLEEQLRKLAAKHRLAVADEKGRPRSAESLSQDLRKVGVLTEVQRKSVIAWMKRNHEQKVERRGESNGFPKLQFRGRDKPLNLDRIDSGDELVALMDRSF